MGEIINIPGTTLANNLAEYRQNFFRLGVVSENEPFGIIVTVNARMAFYNITYNKVSFILLPDNNDGYSVQIGAYTAIGVLDNYYTYNYTNPWYSGFNSSNTWNSLSLDYSVYDTVEEAERALGIGVFPITYHYTDSTVSGPSEAAIGDTVTVSAVPDVGYGITDTSTQILVTNNDVAVPYTWDAANNRITFTMPDPS